MDTMNTHTKTYPHVWHGPQLGCGIFVPSTDQLRRQQHSGLSLVVTMAGSGTLRLDGGPARRMDTGSVIVLNAGHRLWRNIQRGRLGFINLPPGSEQQLSAVCGLQPGAYHHRLERDQVENIEAQLTMLVNQGRTTEPAGRMLPPLLTLAYELLQPLLEPEHAPDQVRQHIMQQIEAVACEAGALATLIPDYHIWRQQAQQHLPESPGTLRRTLRLQQAKRLLTIQSSPCKQSRSYAAMPQRLLLFVPFGKKIT